MEHRDLEFLYVALLTKISKARLYTHRQPRRSSFAFTSNIQHSMSVSRPPSITVDPHFRIQVLFENEPGVPTKEFEVGHLSEPTFDALVAHVFRMTSFDGTLEDYNLTFKYQVEEVHASRWVNFECTEGLGYAVQSTQKKGYAFISASIVKKAAAAPVQQTPSPVHVRSTTSSGSTKTKIAKKSRATKSKAPSRDSGSKIPLDRKILTSLKELFDLGITLPERQQVALLSDYLSAKISTFANTLSKLKAQQLIDYPDSKTV